MIGIPTARIISTIGMFHWFVTGAYVLFGYSPDWCEASSILKKQKNEQISLFTMPESRYEWNPVGPFDLFIYAEKIN